MHKSFPPEPVRMCAASPGAQSLPDMSRLTTNSGFSLVEVAMAIAVIGFAFVALIGMLPSGMRIFRGTMDSANESWILQDLNAVIQTTSWSKIDGLAAEKGGDVFIYDEEGKLADRLGIGSLGSPNPEQARRWHYAVKIIVEPAKRPGISGGASATLPADTRMATVLIAHINNLKAMEQFVRVQKAADLTDSSAKSNSGFRARSFIITRMDSAFD